MSPFFSAAGSLRSMTCTSSWRAAASSTAWCGVRVRLGGRHLSTSAAPCSDPAGHARENASIAPSGFLRAATES